MRTKNQVKNENENPKERRTRNKGIHKQDEDDDQRGDEGGKRRMNDKSHSLLMIPSLGGKHLHTNNLPHRGNKYCLAPV